MKKLFISILSLFAIFSVAACGKNKTQGGNGDDNLPTSIPTEIEDIFAPEESADPTNPVQGTEEGLKYDANGFLAMSEVIKMAKANNPTEEGEEDYKVTGTPNFTVPAGGYDGSPVTITFYHTMGQNLRDVLDAYIPEFNALYPNITVVHEQVGGYDDVRNQISTELTVGNEPNIAYCYPDHVALYNLTGAVTTLDNLINSTEVVTLADGTQEVLGLTQEQKDDFIKGYYNEGRQFGDGLMYTMPLSKSTEVLYYNKTFFEKYGIQVPTHWFSEGANDTTSMEYVMQQITYADPLSIPLGYDSEANLFITMCEQIGSPYTSATGEHFLFDNDVNKAVLNRFRSWYTNALMTTQTLYGSYTSGLFISETSPKSYMSIGSSAGATHQRPAAVDGAYPFEVGIAPIPQMNVNNPKAISQGPSLCIFNKTNPQEVIASWLFMKFLTTTVEFQAEFSMTSGYVPVLESVGSNPYYAKWLEGANGTTGIAALSAKVCLEQKDAYYTSPAFNGSSTARDEVGELLTKVISSKDADVKAMIDKAFKDAVTNCKFYS